LRLGQKFIAEPVTLGTESEDRRAWKRSRRQRFSLWVERDEWTALRSDGAEAVDRHGEVQARAAAQSIRMPRVLTADREDSGCTSGCCNTDRRAQVA
jgi:hypothetical protein